jgi:cutinase
MPQTFARRRAAALAVALAAGAAGLTVGAAPAASAASCSDVDVVFARGTGETAGLGIVGTPLVSSLQADLPGKSVSSYAVNYAANSAQTSAGPGATDMTNHVTATAASCPNTSFVLGGYSQGASVTDISIGIPTALGTGQTIPTSLAPRVKAVVVFGNPLRLYGQTIVTASTLYGPKAKEFCNLGDPVCANGFDISAHLLYAVNGSVQSGAQFAAAKITAS